MVWAVLALTMVHLFLYVLEYGKNFLLHRGSFRLQRYTCDLHTLPWALEHRCRHRRRRRRVFIRVWASTTRHVSWNRHSRRELKFACPT